MIKLFLSPVAKARTGKYVLGVLVAQLKKINVKVMMISHSIPELLPETNSFLSEKLTPPSKSSALSSTSSTLMTIKIP